MTGVDPAREFRGRYFTRAKGRSMLAARGGMAAIAEAYGMPEILPGKAARGDVLLLARSRLGLVGLDGRSVLVVAGEGLVGVPCWNALKAWKV